MPTGAWLNGPWSTARQGCSEQCSTIAWLEQSSTAKGTGAELNSACRNKASTAPGAMLHRDDRSSALRSFSWSNARQLRAQEQGSTVPAGAELNGPLEQCSTGMIGEGLDDRLVGARLNNPGHWSRAQRCLPEQSSTDPGARLDRDDRSRALRSLG